MADLDIPPLFADNPHLVGRVARIALGTFPTRVQRLKNLEKRLGFKSLWIKRDDQSGTLHGGNKVRKLEYLLAGLNRGKGQSVLAYGPVASNWTLACAIYARFLEIPVRLLLFRMKGVPGKKEAEELSRELSAEVEILTSPVLLPFRLLSHLLTRSPGNRCVIMPPGGTSSKSILGYVDAYLELKRQVSSGLLPMPDVIVLPMGTGGTAAGLAAGVVFTGGSTKVIGVRVASSFVSNAFLAGALANRALRFVARDRGSHTRVTREVLQVDSSCYGPGYGRATTAGEEAAKLMGGEEGLILDTTYTAKAAALLVDRAGEGWGRGLNVLFWHTLNSVPLERVREAFS